MQFAGQQVRQCRYKSIGPFQEIPTRSDSKQLILLLAFISTIYLTKDQGISDHELFNKKCDKYDKSISCKYCKSIVCTIILIHFLRNIYIYNHTLKKHKASFLHPLGPLGTPLNSQSIRLGQKCHAPVQLFKSSQGHVRLNDHTVHVWKWDKIIWQ